MNYRYGKSQQLNIFLKSMSVGQTLGLVCIDGTRIFELKEIVENNTVEGGTEIFCDECEHCKNVVESNSVKLPCDA